VAFSEYLNFNKLSKPKGLFLKSPYLFGGANIEFQIRFQKGFGSNAEGLVDRFLGASFQQNFFGFNWGGKSITKT